MSQSSLLQGQCHSFWQFHLGMQSKKVKKKLRLVLFAEAACLTCQLA